MAPHEASACRIAACPFAPRRLGGKNTPEEDRSEPEVATLTELFRHLAQSGLDLDSADTRLAIVTSGPAPLAVSVDRPGEFFLLHEVKGTYPVTESADVARLIAEHLGVRPPEAGESL
jgi:hypothetical protein